MTLNMIAMNCRFSAVAYCTQRIGGMVSKATHAASIQRQTLIGFINYTACCVSGAVKLQNS